MHVTLLQVTLHIQILMAIGLWPDDGTIIAIQSLAVC